MLGQHRNSITESMATAPRVDLLARRQSQTGGVAMDPNVIRSQIQG